MMASEKPRVKFNKAGDLLVSSAQLCDLLRVTPEIISRYHKSGMPKAATGWWNLREVLVYLGQAKADKTKDQSAATRKLIAEADYKESRAAREKKLLDVLNGEYVSRADVAKEWSDRILELKSSLIKLGKRVGSEFTDPEERATVERVVSEVAEDYLESYSRKGEYTPEVKTGKSRAKS